MKYTVIVSDTAKKQLARHIGFLAKIDKGSAARTKDRLMSAFKSLAELPQHCPFLDEEYIPKNKYHKMFADKRYIILYQIKDSIVYVDDVIDCQQDYSWLIK